jgi:hypothetical protein
MKEVELYRDIVNDYRKGSITIDNEDYAAELKITNTGIEIRFFDFNSKMTRDFSSLIILETAVFYGDGLYFRLWEWS